MIYEVKKDLLTSEGIIAHQANCRGVMGAGVAKQIKEKLLPADEFKKYQDTRKTSRQVRDWIQITLHCTNLSKR